LAKKNSCFTDVDSWHSGKLHKSWVRVACD
jgi:hypothetical protein